MKIPQYKYKYKYRLSLSFRRIKKNFSPIISRSPGVVRDAVLLFVVFRNYMNGCTLRVRPINGHTFFKEFPKYVRN